MNSDNLSSAPSSQEFSLSSKEPAGRVERMLRGVARFDYNHSWPILVLGVVLAILGLYYAKCCLFFDSNRANLVARSPELQAEQDVYEREFPQAEDMVVMIEGGTKKDRETYADDLCAVLRSEKDTFDFVFERTDLSQVLRCVLQFVDADILKRMADSLEDNADFIRKAVRCRHFTDFMKLKDEKSMEQVAANPRKYDADFYKTVLPVINEFVSLFTECMESRGSYIYHSPILTAFRNDYDGEEEGSAESSAAEGVNDEEEAARMSALEDAFKLQKDDFYLYNEVGEGRIYLVLVRPALPKGGAVNKDEAVHKAVTRIRQIISDMSASHADVQVSLTGEIVLDYDEAQSSSDDSFNSSILSLILVALVFAWAFREVARPLMAVFTLAVGVSWTLGAATLMVGHLNLLTVTCTTILIGLGIDFGIHFIYRYDEERNSGLAPLPAMENTLMGAGTENLTGAVSTALAFYALIFTDFTGISELGTIAGSGVLLCYLAMATLLPAFIFIQDRRAIKSQGAKVAHSLSHFRFLAKLEQFWLVNCDLTVAICTLFSLWSLWYATYVHYDYNLLNLQAKGLPAVTAELHLISSSSHSLLNAVSIVKDPVEANRLMEEYQKLPTVASVECVSGMIPVDYQKKLPQLRRIVNFIKTVAQPKPVEDVVHGGASVSGKTHVSTAAQLQSMGKAIENSYDQVDAAIAKLEKDPDPQVSQEASRLRENLNNLFEVMESMGPGPIEDSLAIFEHDVFQDIYGIVTFLKKQQAEPSLSLDSLCYELKRREIGTGGYFQVRVFPKDNVWERSALEKFVQDCQKVDPHVIGMPVVTYYDTQELRHSNEVAGVYALVAIWVLLFLYFRNIKVALLAIFPKVIGVLWMVGLMGFCGVDFNSANFLSLPLILGIGLVFGVHVVHRTLSEGDDGVFSHSTGPSIALAALTTMIGFGTLVMGNHQGVSSLGWVMTVGVGANLFSSVVFLPALMRLLKQKGIQLKLK